MTAIPNAKKNRAASQLGNSIIRSGLHPYCAVGVTGGSKIVKNSAPVQPASQEKHVRNVFHEEAFGLENFQYTDEFRVQGVSRIVDGTGPDLAIALARRPSENQIDGPWRHFGESMAFLRPSVARSVQKISDVAFKKRNLGKIEPIGLGRKAVPFDRAYGFEAG